MRFRLPALLATAYFAFANPYATAQPRDFGSEVEQVGSVDSVLQRCDLMKIFPNRTLGKKIKAGDRQAYELLPGSEQFYVGGIALGNFTSSKSLECIINGEKKGIEDKLFSPELFISFCVEDDKNVQCGYGIFQPTYNPKDQEFRWTLTRGEFNKDETLRMLAGKVSGTVQNLPSNYDHRTGIIIESFVEKPENCKQQIVVAFNDRDRLERTNEKSQIVKVKEIPWYVPFHLKENSQEMLIVDGPFDPLKKLTRKENEEILLDYFPKLSEWGGFDDLGNLDISTDEQGNTVSFENISCASFRDVLNVVWPADVGTLEEFCDGNPDKVFTAELGFDEDGNVKSRNILTGGN